MPDGGILPGARSMAGKSLLFPLSPEPGETLLGLLMRSAEHNYLPSPSPILNDLGVNLHLKGDCLGRLADNLPLLADVLGQPLADIHRVWGAEPLSGGRRRLGGVWLRPGMIFSSHRRLPRAFVPGSADQAFWMVRNLGFCPQSWELLVDRCPRPWCGRRLTWCSTGAMHLCGYCGAGVGEAKRRLVPVKDRPALTWLTGLFSEDEGTVERALKQLPPMFELETATEAFEFLHALANPMRALSSPEKHESPISFGEIASACRFILDFPRSHWDLQQVDRAIWLYFRQRLERVAHWTTQAVVQREIHRLLQYGRSRARTTGCKPKIEGWYSVSTASIFLGVQRASVRALIDSGLLSATDGGGGAVRQHSAIRASDVLNLKLRILERMSWREFCSKSGLPQIALEQLLVCGLLRANYDKAVSELFGDRQLERDSVANLDLRWDLLSDPEEFNWVPLSRVMQGVGGREKPWARVIQAGLSGALPGGFRANPTRRGLIHHMVHPITARRLIMGGPDAQTPFSFRDGDLGEHWRPDLSPGETELHLNCTAQDIMWLRSQKLVSPINAKGKPARYARSDIEMLGREFTTTREIAARLGIKPVDVWQSLTSLASGGAFGQGFFKRALVEPLLRESLENNWDPCSGQQSGCGEGSC